MYYGNKIHRIQLLMIVDLMYLPDLTFSDVTYLYSLKNTMGRLPIIHCIILNLKRHVNNSFRNELITKIICSCYLFITKQSHLIISIL